MTNLGSVVLACNGKPTLSSTSAQHNTRGVQLTQIALHRSTAPIEIVEALERPIPPVRRTATLRYEITDRFPGFAPRADDIVQAIPQRLVADITFPRIWLALVGSPTPMLSKILT